MMCPNRPSDVSPKLERNCDYDVVIIGGSFSGASTGILLKRKFPDLNVLIIERSEDFDRKVGESTSDVAGCFLTKVLKQSRHLALNHVTKHGLRMWFCSSKNEMPADSTEVGPARQGPYPTYQLNRRVLDQHLLNEAIELGCDLVRPAAIKNLQLEGIDQNTISYRQKGESDLRTITASWVIDASGRAAFLSKKLGLWRKNTDEHPVSSMWTRFRNIKDLDSAEAEAQMDSMSSKVINARGTSTNHLVGFGWWSWIIPLHNGEVSAGVTWDERLFEPPSEGTMSERVKEHLLQHPVGKLMFENAEAVEDDNRYYQGLGYYSKETSGPGWAIVGDAAGFMDPLYSQGLDYCGHTVYSTYDLLRTYFSGECVDSALKLREGAFERSYKFWFQSLYKDKYYYIGDAELMYAAFLLDQSSYFLGPVRLVYEHTDTEFARLPFHGRIGAKVAAFMSFYNRRLALLARKKIAKGDYGNKNSKRSFIAPKTFSIGKESMYLGWVGIRVWLLAELKYAFVKPAAVSKSSPATPMPDHSVLNASSQHSRGVAQPVG